MSKQLTLAEMQAMIVQSRFHQLFRPQVLKIAYDPLQLVIKMVMREEFERQPGTKQWHGGAISAIIDTTGCYGLALLAAEPLPTINFRTDYLRPAIGTDLTATATVRQAGRRIGVVDVDVTDDAERLIAVGRACYSINPPLPNT
ncbi:MAG TPA: PaaI family thioesterase [Deltaproteobacteria bacterium]|jgi:uncharacterized protein (TIGR00369 family)|nr:PaaI family thioesterase [Candidatus Lambdaproteobacteria bacterium]HIL15301.1 PaaI family thioesterase [Deltaproteobacteria bacterium]